jgi:hypothetical protein
MRAQVRYEARDRGVNAPLEDIITRDRTTGRRRDLGGAESKKERERETRGCQRMCEGVRERGGGREREGGEGEGGRPSRRTIYSPPPTQ